MDVYKHLDKTVAWFYKDLFRELIEEEAKK